MADKPPKSSKSRSTKTAAAGGSGSKGAAPPGAAEVPEHKEAPPKIADPGESSKIGVEGDGVDTPPERKKRRKRKAPKAAIEKALTQLLADTPAMVATFAGDEWAVEHFSTRGPAFASQIAEVADRNDAVRRFCERLMNGEATATIAFAGIMYAVPPMIHWGLLPIDGALFGVPEREAPPEPYQAVSGLGADPQPTGGRQDAGD